MIEPWTHEFEFKGEKYSVRVYDPEAKDSTRGCSRVYDIFKEGKKILGPNYCEDTADEYGWSRWTLEKTARKKIEEIVN